MLIHDVGIETTKIIYQTITTPTDQTNRYGFFSGATIFGIPVKLFMNMIVQKWQRKMQKLSEPSEK